METKQDIKAGYLYKMAWAFEILAASTGLTIALVTALNGESFNAAVLPLALTFALVAVAELTKIPMTTVALGANTWKWRIFFGACTAMLMLITFETMVNGLSNGAAYQTEQVTVLDEELLEKRTNLSNIIANRTLLEESVVGGTIETNLKLEREKTETRLAAFNCETVTEKRSLWTLGLTKNKEVHVNQACAAQQEKQQKRLDETQAQLDQIKSGAFDTQEKINEANANADVAKKEIKDLTKEKAEIARTNNIYTMAFTLHNFVDYLYGIEREEELISPAQLSQGDVNRTVQIFFGILALVVSCTGPILAAAFIVINYENGVLTRKVTYDTQGNVISDNQSRTLASFSGNDNINTF